MRAEFPFSGGPAREAKRTLQSLVLGGALLFVANFGSRLRAAFRVYRLPVPQCHCRRLSSRGCGADWVGSAIGGRSTVLWNLYCVTLLAGTDPSEDGFSRGRARSTSSTSSCAAARSCICVFRRSSCVKGFVCACGFVVVASAARRLGSAARRGGSARRGAATSRLGSARRGSLGSALGSRLSTLGSVRRQHSSRCGVDGDVFGGGGGTPALGLGADRGPHLGPSPHSQRRGRCGA